MAAVAWGRPKIYTAAIAVAALIEALTFELFGCGSLVTAGIAYSASIAIALLFTIMLLRARPLWAVRT
jgi:hypothetical protein